MRRVLISLVLSLTLFAPGCASLGEELKAKAIEAGTVLIDDLKEAGKEAAADIAKLAAEKGAEAAANAVAAKVQADDELTAEEKQDITTILYGSGSATFASIIAALAMWGKARARKLALGVVVRAVDKLPSDIADAVKGQVTALGGSAPAIKKTISSVKG